LICSGDAVATIRSGREFRPGIRLALLQAQRDAPPLFVDVEHHDFDLVAKLYDLRRVDVLVGPVHLGHVHQAFHALFDFDEAAVVRNVRDLAEQTRVRRIAPRDAVPGIIAELLDAQRYA
jgi:hypothetical protein